MSTADPHSFTGAYALHALDEDERAGVERHLAQCVSCALEVAEFEATAARLGLAATVPVRPELRAEVLRRIASVRQMPPGTTPAARRRPRRRRPARRPLAG
ncbi:zf-HC2 domain-containing protein, partial [Streptomyces sp. NPDC059597]|uniref:RskA family anti-sigma factor n=1 Tax=Streptomyces sp. NPDC059597 TaxID=3346879 RepID=UPI003682AA51